MWNLINMSYCNSTYSNFTQSSLIQSWVLFGPLWIHNVKCTSVVIFSCVRCVCGGAAGIFVLSWQPPKGKTTRYETALHLPPVPKLAGPSVLFGPAEFTVLVRTGINSSLTLLLNHEAFRTEARECVWDWGQI